MTDRSDPPEKPSTRGPWPEVTDVNQVFDTGAWWCVNADGHPEYDYPDPEIHVPAHECRSVGLVLPARFDLSGRDRILDVYVARPYRFGAQRTRDDYFGDRRVLLDVLDSQAEPETRLSLTLGDGLRLARHLARLIDVVDVPPRR